MKYCKIFQVTEAVFGSQQSSRHSNGSQQPNCHSNCTGKTLHFNENNMVIQNIDVESIEPVDSHMRDSLMQSVQLTIEMSTTSIELNAQHEASEMEQSCRGTNCNNKKRKRASLLEPTRASWPGFRRTSLPSFSWASFPQPNWFSLLEPTLVSLPVLPTRVNLPSLFGPAFLGLVRSACHGVLGPACPTEIPGNRPSQCVFEDGSSLSNVWKHLSSENVMMRAALCLIGHN